MKEIIYDWFGLNAKIFYAINGLQNDMLDHVMLLGTGLGKFIIFPLYLIIIIITAYFATRKNPNCRKKWAEVILTLIISFIFYLVWVHLLKSLFHFPRPFAILPEGSVHIMPQVRAAENPNVSFPSGHSAFAMLMIAGLWPILSGFRKISGSIYLIWVGISRVYLGVHFPADVVWSMLLSLIAVLVIRILLIKLFKNQRFKPLFK